MKPRTYTEAQVREIVRSMAKECYDCGDFYGRADRRIPEATIANILTDSLDAVLDADTERDARGAMADLKLRMEVSK